MIDTRPKTIFCDIDGALLKHVKLTEITKSDFKPELLDGTLEKLYEWDSLGYNIILTTGRRENMRKKTEEQLSNLGIIYDSLIMGIGGGKRILINDLKPNNEEEYAIAINIKRNTGITNINI